MQQPLQPRNWQIILVLVMGVLAASTAAILVRLALREVALAKPAIVGSSIGFSLVLAASRLSLAAIALTPKWRSIATHKPAPTALAYAIAAGIALAFHFGTWITSLSYTSIAASTALVTTNPIWVTLLSWLWFGEQPSRPTLAGITVALMGGMIISLGGSDIRNSGSNPLLGNSLALIGAGAASLYFLLGQQAQKRGLGIATYATIAYSVAAIALLPLPLLLGTSYTGYSPRTYGYILLMALLPQLVGHTSLNWVIRWVSPTLVSLAILFEPVASSFLGYAIFGEAPAESVLVGGMLLLLGVAMALVSHRFLPGSLRKG